MKLLRRVLLTAALLLLTALMIGAAEKYNDLLYLFYPSFCREVLGYLATWAAKFDYVLWQRLCWVAAEDTGNSLQMPKEPSNRKKYY